MFCTIYYRVLQPKFRRYGFQSCDNCDDFLHFEQSDVITLRIGDEFILKWWDNYPVFLSIIFGKMLFSQGMKTCLVTDGKRFRNCIGKKPVLTLFLFPCYILMLFSILKCNFEYYLEKFYFLEVWKHMVKDIITLGKRTVLWHFSGKVLN